MKMDETLQRLVRKVSRQGNGAASNFNVVFCASDCGSASRKLTVCATGGIWSRRPTLL